MRRLIWVWACSIAGFGCAPAGGGGEGGDGDPGQDCRLAAFACAPGFTCAEDAAGWSCALIGDSGVVQMDAEPKDADRPADPTDRSVDYEDPDSAVPEGPDAGGPSDGMTPEPDAEPDAQPDPEPEPDPEPQPEPEPEPDPEPQPEPEPERSGPGGPCVDDADCRLGRCVPDPDGRCVIACADDEDCGPDAACVTEVDGEPTCVERCEAGPCRQDWICADVDDRPVCLPDCALTGCREGLACRIDGVCAPPMCNPIAERCDGGDDDCDGRVDEGAPCAAGSRCEAGRCRALSGPAAACNRDDDCQSGACLPPAEIPGGFCYERCLDDGDCGAGGICALDAGDGSICGQACDVAPCRAGWVCADFARPFVCVPSCQATGCDEGRVCRPDGFCDYRYAQVIVEQVFIAPTKSNGDAWDGFRAPPAGAVQAAAAALGAANPIAALLGAIGPDVLGAYDAPDPYGTATLTVDGIEYAIELPEYDDTFAPNWLGVAWNGVVMTDEIDVRLRIRLTDSDLVNDDPIGTVSISGADMRDALQSGQVFPVIVNDQGAPILLVAISVIEQ